MRFHNGSADAKSHASAMGFGGKEGIEDLIHLLCRQPDARIADRHHKLLILPSLRLDGELTSARDSLHSIDAVEHEVHENLLQLDTVCHDLGEILSKVNTD